MARASPIEFKMYFKVHFETVIRGHHVTSIAGPPLLIKFCSVKDSRAEAQEHDSNAVGVYLLTAQSDAKKTLAGHVPIELSHLLKNFLEAEAGNKLCAQVTGKRKREVGLVVPAKFTALTSWASHSKNSGKSAYRPSRETVTLKYGPRAGYIFTEILRRIIHRPCEDNKGRNQSGANKTGRGYPSVERSSQRRCEVM